MTGPVTGIDRAIGAAGSQNALGELLGVTQQVISKWQRRGWVPLRRARQISTHFAIDAKELVDPELKEWVL